MAIACPSCAQTVSGPPLEEAMPGHAFVRCGGCDLVFTEPMPRVDGEWYRRQEMYQVRDAVAKPRLQWNHKQFLKDLPENGGRLLDVGCGTGEFVAAAAAAGYDACGFDFDEKAVEAAQNRYGLVNVFSGDLKGLAKPQFLGRFDVVTAFEVLEHSPAPAEFVRTVAGLVKPGGYAAISVPNRERRPRFRYDWDFPPNHMTRWSRPALRAILERNGFQVVREANGWRQGEPFLHQHLRFGVVTRLMGKKGAGAGNGSGAASRAYRAKELVVRLLAAPLNMGLALFGETGMTLYVLARKRG